MVRTSRTPGEMEGRGSRNVFPESREEFLALPLRSIPEVAGFLKMPYTAVSTLANSGAFPGVKVGKQWRLSTRGVMRVVDGEVS